MEENKEVGLTIWKKQNIFKKAIEYLLSTRWYTFVLGIIMLVKTIFFYRNTVFKNDTIWLWSVRQTCFFIVILVFPTLLLKKSVRRFEVGTIINLIVSVVLFADELYYTYASNILSVMQVGNMQYKDEIIAAIPTLLNKSQVLYFIDFLIIAILMMTRMIRIKANDKFRFVPAVVTFTFIVFFCTSYHLIPESLELVTGFIYSKYKSVRYGTIYGYHFVDIKNAITNKKVAPYDSYDKMMEAYAELKNYKSENEIDSKNGTDYNGIAKRKNVFVVQLESVQKFVIGSQINGKEITPNLNRFFNENINVANMHASSYTTTADSEHSFITSIYPSENGEAFSKYYSNTYDDIFKKFKTAGYTNIYAHGNYDTFWNRKNVFSKYSLDKVYFINDFADTSELIRTYLSDELLYKQIFDMLPDTDSPLFVDLVAASSHKPFELAGIQNKEEKVSIDVGKYLGTEFGNYLEAVNYADYAFGIFLDELKSRGLYDDCVIVVYGDHYGMTMYDENLIEYLGEKNENYNDIRMQYEFSNVACGIKIPGINNIKIEYPVSKVDIKPTLEQICGFDDEFALGTSIFEHKPYVCINNGKIITDEFYYDSESWYYLKSGDKVDMESIDVETKNKLDSIVKNAEKEIGLSMSVLTENLLKDHIN